MPWWVETEKLKKMSDPLKSFTTQKEIGGHKTDIACAAFADRNFVVVTQYRKIGTIVSVKYDSVQNNKPTHQISVLLGEDKLNIQMVARRIAEVIQHNKKSINPNFEIGVHGKPLLCTLALKEISVSSVTEICDEIVRCGIF